MHPFTHRWLEQTAGRVRRGVVHYVPFSHYLLISAGEAAGMSHEVRAIIGRLANRPSGRPPLTEKDVIEEIVTIQSTLLSEEGRGILGRLISYGPDDLVEFREVIADEMMRLSNAARVKNGKNLHIVECDSCVVVTKGRFDSRDQIVSAFPDCTSWRGPWRTIEVMDFFCHDWGDYGARWLFSREQILAFVESDQETIAQMRPR